MTTTLARCLLIGVLAAGAALGPAAAQTYPSRPVTFVVPFAPGGGTEFLARMLGQRLEQRLGKPFLIEHRPGAGGVTGAIAAARATPDGHTILMAPSPVMAINVTLHKKLPYDPAADFVPLALVVLSPYVLVVNPSLPVHSVADLVRLAKQRSGQLSYASAGAGTPHHLFAELFKAMTGTEIAHVPYRGSVPALTDVAAGHVALMFCDLPPALSLIRDGGCARSASRPRNGWRRCRTLRRSPRLAYPGSTPPPGRWWSRRPARPSRGSSGCTAR